MAASAMPEKSKQISVLSFEERVKYLEEFHRLEQFNATCRVEHVMAVLDCARSSVYANRKLMAKRKKRAGRGIGFLCSDVREAQTRRGGLS